MRRMGESEGEKGKRGSGDFQKRKKASQLFNRLASHRIAVFSLLDIERVFGEDYPGVVGVQEFARDERYTAKLDAYIAFSNTFPCGTDPNRAKRLNADIQFFQIVYLTD